MQLVAQEDAPGGHGRNHRLLHGRAGYLAARANEDDRAGGLGPLDLLLQARQQVLDNHDLRAGQAVGILIRHVAGGEVLGVPVVELLVLGQDDDVEAQVEHGLSHVILELRHLAGGLALAGPQQFLRADAIEPLGLFCAFCPSGPCLTGKL
jgi:hypothetical protein